MTQSQDLYLLYALVTNIPELYYITMQIFVMNKDVYTRHIDQLGPVVFAVFSRIFVPTPDKTCSPTSLLTLLTLANADSSGAVAW